MDTSFAFSGLFVLDLANNHQGSVAHAREIIRQCGEVAAANGARAALKFQFRNLPDFIHPAHRERSANKHIPRFLGTALDSSAHADLAAAVRAAGLITMATPFDEESVDLAEALDIEVIKIASCSAADWPLLERVAQQNRPVLVSTGGLSLDAIDDLVSFLEHRRVHFALMHCVAIYPTPPEHLQLNQIEVIKRRHPRVTVGFSTHERPDDFEAVMVAVAKGAEILERHVGIATDTIALNAYSSTPAQVDRWMKSAARARAMCGAVERPAGHPDELASLASLARGVYARQAIKAGDLVRREDVYFAMPIVDGGLTSGQLKDGTRARVDIEPDAPLMLTGGLELPAPHPKDTLIHAIHYIKAKLNEARIALPTDFRLEFSHHYGVDQFRTVGAVLIDCINRDYCKKLIVQLPGQRHPNHYHKQKDETFQVLDGMMEVDVEGRRRTLYPGDTLVVPQGVWHSFWTETGVIFEEISTTHRNNDSFYEDKAINAMAREERKTVVSQWGRYQF